MLFVCIATIKFLDVANSIVSKMSVGVSIISPPNVTMNVVNNVIAGVICLFCQNSSSISNQNQPIPTSDIRISKYG